MTFAPVANCRDELLDLDLSTSALERQHESTGLGVRGPGFAAGPLLSIGP